MLNVLIAVVVALPSYMLKVPNMSIMTAFDLLLIENIRQTWMKSIYRNYIIFSNQISSKITT